MTLTISDSKANRFRSEALTLQGVDIQRFPQLPSPLQRIKGKKKRFHFQFLFSTQHLIETARITEIKELRT